MCARMHLGCTSGSPGRQRKSSVRRGHLEDHQAETERVLKSSARGVGFVLVLMVGPVHLRASPDCYTGLGRVLVLVVVPVCLKGLSRLLDRLRS